MTFEEWYSKRQKSLASHRMFDVAKAAWNAALKSQSVVEIAIKQKKLGEGE